MLLYFFNNIDEYLKYKSNYYQENNLIEAKYDEIDNVFCMDEIEEIIEIGDMDTIDIEVDGDNLFVCNDILVHNSAMGDMTDVTEEHIQGGVTKTQTADNVIAIIPSSAHRQANMMHMKLLKTRDSGGVWKTLKFIVDWEKLKITPNLSKDEIEKIEKLSSQCEYEYYNEEKEISKKNPQNETKSKSSNEKLKEKLKMKKKKNKLIKKIDVKKPKNDDDIIDEEMIKEDDELNEELNKNNPFAKKSKKLSILLDEEDDLSIIGKGK